MMPKILNIAPQKKNRGTAHTTKIWGADVNTVMLKMNDLAVKRGLAIVKDPQCNASECKLVYQSSS